MNKYDVSEIRLPSWSRPDSDRQPWYDRVTAPTSVYIRNKKNLSRKDEPFRPFGPCLRPIS